MTSGEPVSAGTDEKPIPSDTTEDSQPSATASETTVDAQAQVEPKTEGAEETETASKPTIETMRQQLDTAKQEAKNHWESLLRKQADYENLQKRVQRDLDNTRKYALEKFAGELLSIKDSMELGLEAALKPETQLDTVKEGIALTLKMLTDAMAKFDILEINPQGQKFDPHWHEAMVMQPSTEVEAGNVLHVHQKGYQLNDRLLRPARVVVAKAVEVTQEAGDPKKNLENQE